MGNDSWTKNTLKCPRIYLLNLSAQAQTFWISMKKALLGVRCGYTPCRHKSKISEKLGRYGWQNMLRPYLKIWEWEWIFGRAVKTISSLGVRSPWQNGLKYFLKSHQNLDPISLWRARDNLWKEVVWDSVNVYLPKVTFGRSQGQRKVWKSRGASIY